jgi:hypothetical protein
METSANTAKDIAEADLPALQQKLDPLKKNLPDKTGEKAGWNFEKVHNFTQSPRDSVVGQHRQHLVSIRRGTYVPVCTTLYVLVCTSMY